MKKVIKLSERDLTRIIKRVMNEGLVNNVETYTSDRNDTFTLSCNKAISGTLDPEKAYQNNPYLMRGQEILPLTGEFEKFFCKS